MKSIIKEVKSVDYALVFGSIFLLTTVIIIPEIPLFNKLFYVISGTRFFVLVAEILFSIFVLYLGGDRNGCPKIKSKHYFWLITSWLSLSVISAIDSQHVAAALFRVTESIVNVIFLYAAWRFVRRYKEVSLLIRNCLVLGFSLYSVFLVAGWMLFEPRMFSPDFARLFVGFGHIRHFGYYALIALVVSLGLLWRALDNKQRYLSLVYLLCATGAWAWLFVIGGRGPFFAIFVSTAITYFLNKGYFDKRFFAALFVSFIAGLMVSIPVSPESYGPLRLIDTALHSETLNEFSSSRLSIWRDSLRLALEHPFLGIGPDGYQFELTPKHPTTTHPHGILLQIILEWGIPASLLFLLVVFALVIDVSAKISLVRGGKRDIVGIYWVVMSIALFSLVDGILYFPRTVLVFLIMLALLLGGLSKATNNHSSQCCRYVFPIILLASIFISALHAHSLIAVASSPVARIDDKRVANIQLFPSVMTDTAVVSTLANWSSFSSKEVDTRDLLDWYQWAERNSTRPWIFAYLHAELLFKNARQHEAMELLSHYRKLSPNDFQDKLDCLQSRYLSPVTKL